MGDDRSLEYRVPTPDGDTAWVRDVVHVVRGAQGARELRGLMVDITERRRAEQALRDSEQRYSEAFRREREATQRLRNLDEMKNTFLEAVSHDLRTPLTSILGFALTLESSGLDMSPDDALDLVARIAANARKLERLLGDLLDLDRLQRGIIAPQRRPTDLAALVARAVDESDDKGHEIVAEVAEGSFFIDAAKVERIVENLLSNALRHTPVGTQIWIRAEPTDGGVSISVEDAGPGLPEDLHDAVFEPFRQAPGSSSEHSPGVGIGLSLVRRFAELHGGTGVARGTRRRRRVVPRLPRGGVEAPDIGPPTTTSMRCVLDLWITGATIVDGTGSPSLSRFGGGRRRSRGSHRTRVAEAGGSG